MKNRNDQIFAFFSKRLQQSSRRKKRVELRIDKRQKFVLGVLVLSLSLFISEFQFSHSGFFVTIVIAFLTDLVLLWALRQDLKENFSFPVFVLPFIYSLACGFFYFLIPARILARIVLTVLYAFGLYSLFLSQNIFVVASIKTIALLSGARIVGFVIALVSYFFLTNIVFSLHISVVPLVLIVFLYTFALIYQSLWSYTLQKPTYSLAVWALLLTICIAELTISLWFWPTSPTVIALFMTGFYYTIVGLSHVWFEKRLFRGVLWEYVWVGVIVFFVLILFTSWGK